jgi:hypothetical protein
MPQYKSHLNLRPFVLDTTSPTLNSPWTQAAIDYLAEKYGIAPEDILVYDQFQQDFIYLEKSYWCITASEREADTIYKVVVDMADMSASEDISAIEQADKEAMLDKYGKLEPALAKRLESIKPEDTVQVAIWVAGAPERSQQDLYDILAGMYPQAREALERSGNPFDVGDHDKMMEIKRTYLQMVREDNEQIISVAVSYFRSLDIEVVIGEGIPTVFAPLSKARIIDLEYQPWVGKIYLADADTKAEMDSANPSDRVTIVYGNGINGTGADIAILEPGKVDFDDPVQGDNYLQKGEIRPCSESLSEHKTPVSSIASSYHPTYTGIAKGALIHDSCANSSLADAINGLAWATNYAVVINYSAANNSHDGIEYSDMAFDHYARNNYVFITVSAGNAGSYIFSPGLGWNVMTVGGTGYSDNPAWADDTMWNLSNWQNQVVSLLSVLGRSSKLWAKAL